MSADLPVLAVLPALTAALTQGPNAVLIAPPGAGKTTAVPPVLLHEPWAAGRRILLLAPRRLAARAAAERMAATAGEPVGRTVGYRTRLDTRVSAATRIEVVTEGVFTRLIQSDPELAGVAAVIFDEAHERSLEGDLGLALALDAQGALRPDLRLLVMSATLDGARYAALMGGAPVVEAEGRTFPVELRHVGRDPAQRVEEAVARAVEEALAAEQGSVLAFLPGAAEIERTAERLRLPEGVMLHRLHGSLEGSIQRAAIAPAPPGGRKVVLATAIAQTSITIEGVRVVVDSGLARRPRYERGAGLTRLVTERASQAAVAQRAGRAGRTAPGTAIRLWEAAQTSGLPPFDPPELLESDLSGLVLELAAWGVSDPASLRWLDPPPAPAVAEARERLTALGALDPDHRPTPHGRRVAALPHSPAVANMLVRAAERGMGALAAEIAVLLGERGLGGTGADLEARLAAWRGARDPRSVAARRLAERMAAGARDRDLPEDAPGRVLALAFPDRIARARGQHGHYLMANGRGARLEPHDPLTRCEWLAVGEASGAAQAARVQLAARLDRASVEELMAERITREERVHFDPAARAVVAEEVERLGAITLLRRPLEVPAPGAVGAALLEGVRQLGPEALPWEPAALRLRARIAFARASGAELPDLSDAALAATLEDWLAPLLAGVRRLDELAPVALTVALEARLDWSARRALDALAPERFTTPAGTSHAIDYAAPGGPQVAVRVQELFGLAQHPHVGGRPLALVLLSPAQRPIQTTADLPGFWAGSWAAVRAEMRGRYPKHPWPEDPARAPATTRTKRADVARS